MNVDNDKIKQDLQAMAPDWLPRDNSGKGWLCPCCNSGSGPKGTGLRLQKDGVHFKCFACDVYGDIIDIIAAKNGKQDAPYPEKLKDACEEMGYSGRPVVSAPRKPTQTPQAKPVSKAPSASMVDYSAFFEEAAKHIEETKYHRGISLETLKRFKVGFMRNWKHPDHPNAPGTPRLIFPTSPISYFSRLASDANAPYSKQNVGPAHLFNGDVLKTDCPLVYVCEGAIDALSIIDVGGEAVGLNSTSNTKLFMSFIKNLSGKLPMLVLSLDNDEAGKKATEELENALKQENIPYLVRNISGEYKDPNKALEENREQFSNAVNTDLAAEIAEAKIAEQYATWEKLEKSNALYNLEGLKAYINKSHNNFISTGFPNLDKLLDGGIYPGLYFVGAITSLGKTTFCIQMADQIAAQGYNVLFFSLEMSRYEIMAKSISRLTLEESLKESEHDIRYAKTTRGILSGALYSNYKEKDKTIIERAMERYKESGSALYIVEGVGDIGVEAIRATIESFRDAGTILPSVVFVDYLQILAPSDPRNTDKQNTDKAVLELKRISRDYNIAVVAISSFNRENYMSPVNLTSFKESGAVEYSSDVLIGLQYAGMDLENKEGETGDKRKSRIKELIANNYALSADGHEVGIELKVLKNRNGKKGNTLFNMRAMFNAFSSGEKKEEKKDWLDNDTWNEENAF